MSVPQLTSSLPGAYKHVSLLPSFQIIGIS
jgi:hypothetical protein